MSFKYFDTFALDIPFCRIVYMVSMQTFLTNVEYAKCYNPGLNKYMEMQKNSTTKNIQ